MASNSLRLSVAFNKSALTLSDFAIQEKSTTHLALTIEPLTVLKKFIPIHRKILSELLNVKLWRIFKIDRNKLKGQGKKCDHLPFGSKSYPKIDQDCTKEICVKIASNLREFIVKCLSEIVETNCWRQTIIAHNYVFFCT